MRLCALALAAFLPGLAAPAGTARGQAFGNPSAPILIEVYSDFECPGCKQFHTQLLPLVMHDFVTAGKAYIILHDLSFHPHSSEATTYALAAARIGKYKEVADALFQYQLEWSANGKVWDAVTTALSPADRSKVAKLVHDPGVLAEVKSETEDGRTKIRVTPTVLVTHAMKQRHLEWPIDSDMFKKWLNELLKQ